MDLDTFGYVIVALCGFLVGVTKTGIPGIGILVVPLMALAMPGKEKESTGLLLGILILTDIFAIIYHRRNAKWFHVFPPFFPTMSIP